MADFKKLRGNRILLDHPELEEPNLYLDDATKEAPCTTCSPAAPQRTLW